MKIAQNNFFKNILVVHDERHSDLVKHKCVPVDIAPKNTNEGNSERKSDDTGTQSGGTSDDQGDDMMEEANDIDLDIEGENTSDDGDSDDSNVEVIYDRKWAKASVNTNTTLIRPATTEKHTSVEENANDTDFEIEDYSTSDDDDSDDSDIEVIYDGKTANASGDNNTACNRPVTTTEQKFVQLHPVGVLSKQQVCLSKR